ncbi:hypothetical protein [Polaribacter sp. Q13]|uniref:hypothetical protein n=1 Tax=Polaribacter sp. Q13 TaxID=2806551 RepID=UPI00193B7F11|nr:hypothetical protein [Polaribacter sp. Q13]QVY66581.1 hypothetical protein JOP69_04645 [Polaribacter sp. Q13]
MNKFFATIIYIGILSMCSLNAQNKEYNAPKGMVNGGQFIDRFLPVELNGPLHSDVWGSKSVLPRDVLNGIEDETYSYWGGNIMLGDDGKYHMFPCRWKEGNVIGSRSGHMTWVVLMLYMQLVKMLLGRIRLKVVLERVIILKFINGKTIPIFSDAWGINTIAQHL